MKETERAWAAGFFDGEGCFMVHKVCPNPKPPQYRHKSYKYPRVTVSQAHKEVLLRFKRVVECGSIKGPIDKTKYGNERWSDMYCFSVEGVKPVRHILRVLGPYLGSVKKRQARRVLQQSQSSIHSKQ